MNNIKVHYLYHSGFAVETKEHLIIFDYYKDSFPEKEKSIENGNITENFLKGRKNILVFASHRHPDHFNPIIFKWSEWNKNIKYILSSDIHADYEGQNCLKLSKYQDICLKDPSGDIYIKAYGSTDVGVSFLVRLEGVTLFHAGDLNWWYWKDDTKADKRNMEVNFKNEVKKLKGEKIDISFFPVDPRLQEYYLLGGEYFIKEVQPSILFPMHLWNKAKITDKFKNEMKNYNTKIIAIHKNGEVFSIGNQE